MRYILSFILLSLIAFSAEASHYRAGDIFYESIGPNQYRATIITYSDFDAPPGVDRDTIIIDWGDGTIEELSRTNGNGDNLGNNVKKSIFVGTHTYLGAAPFFVISFFDVNRREGINNINGGVDTDQVAFYIEDTIHNNLDPNIYGYNSTPVLLNDPIDYANVLDTFYHNPAAYDVDGDSLFFSLIPPRQSQNSNVPGYQYPNEIFPGPNNSFTINPKTGEIIWAVPQPGACWDS